MTIALTVIVFIAYLAGAYYVFDLHKDEEVDVFENITYQRLAFFFGLMIVLFFSLLFMKIMGDEGER